MVSFVGSQMLHLTLKNHRGNSFGESSARTKMMIIMFTVKAPGSESNHFKSLLRFLIYCGFNRFSSIVAKNLWIIGYSPPGADRNRTRPETVDGCNMPDTPNRHGERTCYRSYPAYPAYIFHHPFRSGIRGGIGPGICNISAGTAGKNKTRCPSRPGRRSPSPRPAWISTVPPLCSDGCEAGTAAAAGP